MADTDHAESTPVLAPPDAAAAALPPAADAAPQPADAAPQPADAAPQPADATPQPADAAPPAAETAAPTAETAVAPEPAAAPPEPAAAPPPPIAAPATLVERLVRVQGILLGEPSAAPLLSIVARAHGLAQGEGLDEGTLQMLRLGLKAARRNNHLSEEVRGELQALSGALPG